MRVLVVHNAYQQRGGEDSVVDSEIGLLRSHGHDVAEYRRSNDDIEGMSRVAVAAQTLWSTRTVEEFDALCETFRPDVVHAHNTFPLISPSVYWGASRRRLPMVQTLHNFRLFCVQAMLLREGKVCEDCLGRGPWAGVARRCYRGSFSQSAVLATMLATHRVLGTYAHKVARYIALNDFCRSKFIEGGLPADRIVVKPNFVEVGPPGSAPRADGLFVGRLSPEKGVSVLAGALRTLDGRARVDVVGTGPDESSLRGVPGLVATGWASGADVLEKMRRARYLVLPSIWYENFPRTLVEAFACGLPVIASRIGALAELVEDRVTGLLFDPGSGSDLARAIEWAESHPTEMARMGEMARQQYEAQYGAQTNHEMLLDIYEQAVSSMSPAG